jgi:hypothetical protein
LEVDFLLSSVFRGEKEKKNGPAAILMYGLNVVRSALVRAVMHHAMH